MKNNPNPFSVGLDIGTTKVVCLVGRKDKYGKIEILAKGESPSTGMERGMVKNYNKVMHAIRSAVEIAEKEMQTRITEVLPGVAGHHIYSQYGQAELGTKPSGLESDDINLINEEHLRELKQSVNSLYSQQGKEVIIAIPQHYNIDRTTTKVQDPVGMQGGHIKGFYHVVLGDVVSIRAVYKCVQKINLKVAGITLEPIASAEAVLTPDEKEMGAAIIDMGGGTTDIAIFHKGIISYTSVIPIGGNAITADISMGLGIVPSQAESLKVEYGKAWPGEYSKDEFLQTTGLRGEKGKKISKRMLSDIIYHRVDETLKMALNQIEKHAKTHGVILNAGIVLTGGGAKLKEIKQLAEYVMRMPVRIGLPSENLSSKTDVNKINSSLNDPRYSTSVGLLIEHIKHYENLNIPMTVPESPTPQAMEQPATEQLDIPEEHAELEKVEESAKPKKGGFKWFKETIEKNFFRLVDPNYGENEKS